VRSKEELANVLSHFAGILLSVAALVIMVGYSAQRGNAIQIFSCAVFGVSMIILYLISTLAHWLPEGDRKERFFTVDQLSIFMLIAGTYTPLALVAVKGLPGWGLFGIEWMLALVGIIRNLKRINQTESGVDMLDIALYVGMGWMFIFFVGAILRTVPPTGIAWIIAGGLFYSLGIYFFRVSKFRYHHLVWHLMVLAGTASHFIAIFFYILP
jgi:hemolysin III